MVKFNDLRVVVFECLECRTERDRQRFIVRNKLAGDV